MNVQPHLLNLSAYINQNLEKDLPLSSLAKRVGLSPFHFHRKFGAYFGESLHQHIKRLRLERAAFSLSCGSKPVREIARESGYKTVSAFSHAFSGFAGQSPTRYRSRAPLEVDVDESQPAGHLRPAWVGVLPDQPFLFLRATAQGRGRQPEVGDAAAVIREALAHPDTADAVDAASSTDEPIELIAATTDLYGVAKGGSFRVDVGVDEARVAGDRVATLGRQLLPGGRYARFDIRCRPDEIIGRAYAAFRRGLDQTHETPRVAPCFIRFNYERDGASEADEFDYKLFVPLLG
jgi:AraC-like DNA-binding protein